MTGAASWPRSTRTSGDRDANRWRCGHEQEIAQLRELWARQQRHLAHHKAGAKHLHYLRKHLDFEPELRRHLRSLDRAMPYVHGRVLEWGCRHGPAAVVLRMRLGGEVELHGADIRDGDLYAPFHAFSGLRYERLADPVALPYPGDHFDVVIAHGVLEHVPHPEGSLRELHRVLAAGGTLLIDALPNRYSYIEAWQRRTGGPAHKRRFALHEITATLERVGFTILDRRRVGMLPMMLTRAGPHVRRRYQRAGRVITAINDLLERRPFDVFGTSLVIAARKPSST
jgi:SAM-dependent methyltransferase